MNSKKIVFDERKFDHGINKLKIVIFVENDEDDFEQQLNEVIEQSKIKILYNVGANQLKYQVKTTVQDNLNPDQQTLISLSGDINKQLFSSLMNVGIISGKQVNNSIKLLLTFYLKYEKTSESTFNSLFKHLDEKDKQDLFQDSQRQLAPVSNILQTTQIKQNQSDDNLLQSAIVYNEINDQSQIQSKFQSDQTCRSDYINKQSDRQCEIQISKVKTDQILSPAEQVQSILYEQENVQGISAISGLVPPVIQGSEGQKPQIQSELISQQQLFLHSNIKQPVIQNQIPSNLGPPHIETQQLTSNKIDQNQQSNNSVKSNQPQVESIVEERRIINPKPDVIYQHKLVYENNSKPKEPKLPDPINYISFKKFQEFKCLK